MNVDVYWLLNVIASALLAGASVKLFVHLAERVHFVEIPPKRLSGMGFCLVMLSTFIGGWYHVGYAALVVAAIVTAWCAISRAGYRFAAAGQSRAPVVHNPRPDPSGSAEVPGLRPSSHVSQREGEYRACQDSPVRQLRRARESVVGLCGWVERGGRRRIHQRGVAARLRNLPPNRDSGDRFYADLPVLAEGAARPPESAGLVDLR